MSLVNLIKSALMNIKARKVRVFLTMFGIIIGISSVVTIVSVGDGLKSHVSDLISDTNAGQYTISYTPKNLTEQQGLVEYFNEQDIKDIERVGGVTKATKASNNLGGLLAIYQVSYFDHSTYIDIASSDKKEIKVTSGRTFINSGEDRKEIVLSKNAAEEIFDDAKDAVGAAVTINGELYEVIGVTEQLGSGILGIDYSYISEANLNSLDSDDDITSIEFTITPGLNADEIFEQINEILKLNHADVDGTYALEDPQEVTKAFDSIIGNLTIFIACISAISLFVGGVGVMNIMYVSVSERKREIGIRRAIGAKSTTILLQFLLEAMIITLFGGILGIGFGLLISKFLDLFLPFTTVLSAANSITAALISVIVGLIFGIVPARNASKMEPIEAIYK